jgi:hypothetical protein
MAKQRYVYMRDEIEVLLKKEDNASKLINDLLEDYFRKKEPKAMTTQELRKFIEKEKMKQEYERRLKEIDGM